MVRSRTRKKSAKARPITNSIPEIVAVTDYLKRWTNRELAKIQTEENYPICIPVNNGYRIGLYHLTVNPNKTCDVLDHNRVFVHRFEDKISAILYTIYTIKKRYFQADEILVLSQEINKSYTDVCHLQNTLDSARKSKNYTTVDTAQARLDLAWARLQQAREKIASIHRLAKINKVWT
jgi:hypothetical protein